jgi:hypothetical protein
VDLQLNALKPKATVSVASSKKDLEMEKSGAIILENQDEKQSDKSG